MKFKSLLSKTSVAALACTMLMSTTAFAASYTTTTEYNLTDLTTVKVTTAVTGAAATEEVAYLVTNKDSANITDPNHFIFIDQKAATGGAADFTFTTNADNIGKAVVKVGTTSTGASQNIPTDDANITGWKLTPTIAGVEGGIVYYAYKGSLGTTSAYKQAINATPITVPDGNTLAVLAPTGTKLASYSIDAAAAIPVVANSVEIPALTKDTAITFTFEAITDAGTPTVTQPTNPADAVKAVISANPVEAPQNAVTAFGTAAGVAANTKYGVALRIGGPSGKVYLLPAKGCGPTGKFAVKLVNGESGLLVSTNTIETATYYQIGNEAAVCGTWVPAQ